MPDPHILRYFAFEHLPTTLKERSRPFSELAHYLVEVCDDPTHPEIAVALRKLLEAKDCAVRAAL